MLLSGFMLFIFMNCIQDMKDICYQVKWNFLKHYENSGKEEQTHHQFLFTQEIKI